MQIKRFLSNFAKSFLVIGALSVSAYAGADDYTNHRYDGFHDGYHDGYHHDGYHHDGYHHYDGCHHDCCPPCCNNPCIENCCGTPCNPAPDCGWAYNPPAYARCGCDTFCCNNSFLDSFAFRADFLWWRACHEGLELGTEEFVEEFTNPTSPPRETVINRSHSKRPDFKYDPGFRIGFANYCSCDCWDFAVNWTHYHTKAHVRGATDEEEGIIFVSDWERVIGANPTRARGRYSLTLDLVDIEFGRKFYTSNCFVLRPQFGLRFARIDQNFRVASEGQGPDSLTLRNYVSDVKSRSDFLSVGPRVGLDLELHLGCGLILFGQAAGSVVFGKFDDHSREHLVDFTTSESNEVGVFDYDQKSSAHRCSRAITDLAFGLKWNRCFEWCNRCHPVSLAFAWEHHAFYNMNTFNFVERGFEFGEGIEFESQRARKHGDLYTQGLTVSLAFGF